MRKDITSLLLFLCFCGTISAFAQTQYWVKLDISTSAITKVKKIDSVRWIVTDAVAYSPARSKCFFDGIDDSLASGKDYRFYSIDGLSGAINAKSVDNYYPHPIATVYSDFNDTVYAVRWDTAAKKEYLVSISPVTCLGHDIVEVPGLKGIIVDNHTIDQAGKRYFLSGVDASSVKRVYTINLATYAISSVPFSLPNNNDNINGIQYDDALGKIFCLYRNSSTKRLYMATLDPTAGTVSTIDSLPAIPSLSLSRTGYDQTNHYYVFNGIDTANVSRLYTVNTANAHIVYSPVFLTPNGGGNPANNNLIYPMYDKPTNTMYALFWEAVTKKDTTNPDTTLAIKPINHSTQGSCLTIPALFTPDNDGSNDRFEIRSSCLVNGFKMQIYNLTGQRVFETNNIGNSWDGSSTGNAVPAGSYYYRIELRTADGKTEQRKGRVILVR